MAARESYISGRRSIGELTATAQSCISLWEELKPVMLLPGWAMLAIKPCKTGSLIPTKTTGIDEPECFKAAVRLELYKLCRDLAH